jgi:hypothetical protein
MGAYSIPLMGQPAPRENPTQAFNEGADQATRRYMEQAQTGNYMENAQLQQQDIQLKQMQISVQQRLAKAYQDATDKVNASRGSRQAGPPPPSAQAPSATVQPVPDTVSAPPQSPPTPVGASAVLTPQTEISIPYVNAPPPPPAVGANGVPYNLQPNPPETSAQAAQAAPPPDISAARVAALPTRAEIYANPPAGNSLADFARPAAQSPTASSPAAPNPSQVAQPPAVDFHTALIESLNQNGLGQMVPGISKQYSDMAISQAKAISDMADAHSKLATQATQLIQGIAGLPAGERDAQYQRVKSQLATLEQKMGGDAAQVPQTWDDSTMKVLAGNGTAVAEHATQLHQAAETARLAQEGIVNLAPKAAEYMQSQAAAITDPQSYQDLRTRIAAYAAQEKKANPNGPGFWQSALDSYPAQWSPAVSQDATLASLKPDERVTYFTKQLNDASQRLKSAALSGPDAYRAEFAAQTTKNPEFSNLFPAAPAPGAKWDAQAVATQAANVGATGEQYITAQNTSQWKEQLNDIHLQMVGIAQQRADTGQQRADQVRSSRGLTPTAVLNEKAKIDADLNGTASSPGGGLNGLRRQIGAQISSGKFVNRDGVEVPLTPQAKEELTQKYEAATDHSQSLQFDRAALDGVQRPDASALLNASDASNGTVLNGPDGSQWKKQDDVFYLAAGPAGQTTPAAPTAQPKTRTGPPLASQPAASPKTQTAPAPNAMSEADARSKATAAGKDPNWYVAQLRSRNLIK